MKKPKRFQPGDPEASRAVSTSYASEARLAREQTNMNMQARSILAAETAKPLEREPLHFGRPAPAAQVSLSS